MRNELSYQERAACPVYTAIGVIEGRWKPMIFQRLTPYGRTLSSVFEVLWFWGTRHLARPGAARGTLVSPPRAPRETLPVSSRVPLPGTS